MSRPRHCGETWVETGTAMQRPLIILGTGGKAAGHPDLVEGRSGLPRGGRAGAAGHPARTLPGGA